MADWIALGLLIVAVVSAGGTIVSLVLSRRDAADRLASEERRHTERLATDERMHDARLEHESEVHTERLAHERREAQRTTAARAYSLARDGLQAVNPSALNKLAARRPERVAEIDKIVEAALELEVIEALGWDKDVCETAMELGAGPAKLAEGVDRVSRGCTTTYWTIPRPRSRSSSWCGVMRMRRGMRTERRYSRSRHAVTKSRKEITHAASRRAHADQACDHEGQLQAVHSDAPEAERNTL